MNQAKRIGPPMWFLKAGWIEIVLMAMSAFAAIVQNTWDARVPHILIFTMAWVILGMKQDWLRLSDPDYTIYLRTELSPEEIEKTLAECFNSVESPLEVK